MKYTFMLKDRQTGKTTSMKVEAKTRDEAKAKALALYGVAYEVK